MNLNPGPLKLHESVRELQHSQWRQGPMPWDFRTGAEFILSNAEGLGVTF